MDGNQAPNAALSAEQEYSREAAKLGHLVMVLDDLPKQIAEIKASLTVLLDKARKEAEAKSASSQTA